MNLTGRPCYQKGTAKKKSKNPTAAQRARWEKLRELGCILVHMGIPHICAGRITIHHCGTGGGGRKNHDEVAPLCQYQHTGKYGIDGRQAISKIDWQKKFCTEDQMLEAVAEIEGNR